MRIARASRRTLLSRRTAGPNPKLASVGREAMERVVQRQCDGASAEASKTSRRRRIHLQGRAEGGLRRGSEEKREKVHHAPLHQITITPY